MEKFSRVLGSKKTASTILMAITVLIVLPVMTFAQITTATIVGTVTDPGGSQVP